MINVNILRRFGINYLSVAEVQLILLKESTEYLDPKVVNAFKSLVNRLDAIK